MPEWNEYWKGYLQTMHSYELAHILPLSPSEIASAFLAYGCEAIPWLIMMNVSGGLLIQSFCSTSTTFRRPLIAFCPQSCGCQVSSTKTDAFCPRPRTVRGESCASVRVTHPGTR